MFSKLTPISCAALVVVLDVLSFPAAQAQQSPGSWPTDSSIAERLGYRRSRTTARVLGAVVPGAGHLYAGEWLKSYPLFVVATGGIYLGQSLYTWDRCTFDWRPSCRPGIPFSSRVAGVAMIASGVAMWVASSVDAGRAVARQRARRARQARHGGLGVQPVLTPCVRDSRAWCVGVALDDLRR
jgi:hypothetical protein